MNEPVTICIPAWRAGDFLEETLESALSQTWPDISIVISVDQCDDDTWSIASRYATGHAVRAVHQPKRLGWIGNTNAALGLAETRYSMNLPHDDILAPDYVAACMDALKAAPDAVLAYSDITFQHEPDRLVVQDSVTGTLESRLITMVAGRYAAVAMRGVFDRMRAPQFGVPEFALGGFAADALWVARMACQGALLRVPRPLYTKRLLPTSVRAAWKAANEQERDEMWAVHCLELAAVIAETLPDLEWSSEFQHAWNSRIMQGYALETPGQTPSWLDDRQSLVQQVAQIHRKVAARNPHYSWMS